MIYDHYIDGANADVETPNVSGDIKPKYLIIYGTTDYYETIVRDFCDRVDIKESAHLYINLAGNVHQFAPLNSKTWHAGASSWQGHHGLNGCAIGVYINDTIAARETLHRLVPEIVAEYNIRDILSHVRPHTRHFDVSAYKRYVEYGNADGVGRFIAVAPVDILGGPDVRFKVLDTLSSGDSVKVLRYSSNGEWAMVLYERRDHTPRLGWTHESFLRRI